MRKITRYFSLLAAVMLIMSQCSVLNVSAGGRPIITLREQKPVIVYKGTQNTITYTLENNSLYIAKNLEATPDLTGTNLEGLTLLNSSFVLSDTSIGPDDPITISLEASVDDTVKAGVYPIKIQLAFDNQSLDNFTKEIMTYFEVKDDDSFKDKVSVVSDNSNELDPVRGKNFTFSYSVSNFESFNPTDVETYIDGLPSEYFVPVSNKSSVYLGELKRNIARDASVEYYMSESTPLGSYAYSIVIEYSNEAGNRMKRTLDRNLFVNEENVAAGKITVSEMTYPESASQDKAFSIGFNLTNTGVGEVEDLMIKMKDNDVFIPKSPAIVKIDSLKAGDTYAYAAELVATGEELKDRNYPIEFEIAYNDGKEDITDSQIMGVYVDAKDSDSDSGNAPKIIISEYRSEPQIVKAGDEFDLYLDFTNTNRSRSIYNVKAYITAKESTEDTGNVFTPVGSSNTFYIDEIGPKQASSQSIRLFTVPDASPKTYNLTINFEYEDADGKSFTAEEFVGVPVTQVSKVEASEFNMPTEVMAGDTNNVYFDIFNTGKAKVYNLLIKVEGNVVCDPISKYVGNFEVGNSDYFDAYITMNEVGQTDGKFIITYEDATGEQYAIEKPFSVTVMEGFDNDMDWDEEAYMDEMSQWEEEAESGSKMPLYIGLGVGGVVLLVVIIILVSRRRKKKMELMFDETD